MMWKKLLGASAVVIVVSFFLYRFIGGGQALEYSIVSLPSSTLYGEWYEGKPESSRLEDLFLRMRDQSSFTDSSYLAVVTLASGKEDTIRQFIGVFRQIAGDTTFHVKSGRYVDVLLDMHPAVRPSPVRVREGADEFSRANGGVLTGAEIQLFTSEDGFRILFPLQD